MDNSVNKKQLHILVFCQHTISAGRRSGIQRVVVELVNELPNHVKVDFVKWDYIDGQLRFLDKQDLKQLFGIDVKPNSLCNRTNYRFDDVLNHDAEYWLLYPELPYHLKNGNEVFARVISQCREYGVKTSVIFYDSIPVREEAYSFAKMDHMEYLAEILRCDCILPISKFSAEDLFDYYEKIVDLSEEELIRIEKKIIPVPLGEYRRGEKWGNVLVEEHESIANSLIMVGTIEPRKQQTRLLKILNDSLDMSVELSNLHVNIYGSLHPDSSDELWREVNRNPNIHYHDYASDKEIEVAYAQACCSAFPSLHEGYGLPIVESLRRGVPCLTADFGAMGEVAEGGGCLTVNVLDDVALRDGLIKIVSDVTLREKLKADIDNRILRSWVDYADDIVQALTGISIESQGKELEIKNILEGWFNAADIPLIFKYKGIEWNCVSIGVVNYAEPQLSADRCLGKTGVLIYLSDHILKENISLDMLRQISEADILIVHDIADYRQLVDAARCLGLDVPLPGHFVALDERDNYYDVIRLLSEVSTKRKRASSAAYSEDLLLNAAKQAPVSRDLDDLAIVISTFNRGPFVELNVEWLLGMIDSDHLPVKCVVIDNASTDDTLVRLSRFFGHPAFVYECNSANTGMLGNLRVASTKIYAKHIWLTGDDDFIVSGAISRTLEVIRSYPRIPFVFHNFGVYHRSSISPADSPGIFLGEMQRLAPNPSKSGIYRVNQVAAEHDNLFTAIYPIVFRADLMSACFNFPFDGIPFDNLVESVPTTKLILETYPYSPSYWMEEIGIVGNAHNSWSGHRPRWHLVLMPAVLKLARDAGVNPHKVWAWSGIHKQLFEEAAEIAIKMNACAHLAYPDDFELANYFFREEIEKPHGLVMNSIPPAPKW